MISNLTNTVIIVLAMQVAAIAFVPVQAEGTQSSPVQQDALPPGTKRYHTQPVLVPGQALQETISITDPVLLGLYRADCYQIQTEPGSRWTLKMKVHGKYPVLNHPVLGVTVMKGPDCSKPASVASEHESGRSVSLSFVAGGGTYLVLVDAWILDASGTRNVDAFDAYTLSAEASPGKPTSKMLPPGSPQVLVPIGTASTAGENVSKAVPGTTMKDCPECPELVIVPAGSFMMGSPSNEEGRAEIEGPRHRVTIARPFAIGKYEVTEEEWAACRSELACHEPYPSPLTQKRPKFLSYFQAMEYVAWLSKRTGQKYFLPSEAEWEYAARAGTDSPWNTGDAIITEDAYFLSRFGEKLAPGRFPPNAFGIHDVHGNVSEWVQDCLADNGYAGAPADGRAVELPNCRRIVRGGTFVDEPVAVRSAARNVKDVNYVGLRVTRALESDD